MVVGHSLGISRQNKMRWYNGFSLYVRTHHVKKLELILNRLKESRLKCNFNNLHCLNQNEILGFLGNIYCS